MEKNELSCCLSSHQTLLYVILCKTDEGKRLHPGSHHIQRYTCLLVESSRESWILAWTCLHCFKLGCSKSTTAWIQNSGPNCQPEFTILQVIQIDLLTAGWRSPTTFERVTNRHPKKVTKNCCRYVSFTCRLLFLELDILGQQRLCLLHCADSRHWSTIWAKTCPSSRQHKVCCPRPEKTVTRCQPRLGPKFRNFHQSSHGGKRWESQMTYVAPAYFCSDLADSSKSPMWRGYQLSFVFCMCLSSPKASGEASPKPQRKPVPTRRMAYSTATLNVLQETVDRKICVCFHTIN